MSMKAESGARHYSCCELAAELAVADGDNFERKALPLIRVLWPGAVGTPRLRAWDRRGADHLVWSDTPPFPLVVQCKGFQVQQLDESQVRQCLTSIESFRDSGLAAVTYLLVHNRDRGHATFQARVSEALATLVSSGRVTRAELWDRDELVGRVYGRLSNLVRADLVRASREAAERVAAFEPELCPPLEEVPLLPIDMAVNRQQMTWYAPGAPCVADPAEEILRETNCLHTILIGEFGFGKTLAVLRALRRANLPTFYLPAAKLRSDNVGPLAILAEYLGEEALLQEFPMGDRTVLGKLCRAAADEVLSDPSHPVAIVIDGLDEAPHLSRRGGLQRLLNQLREPSGPVVLTARSEFWHARAGDFATSFSLLAGSEEEPEAAFPVTLVELLPWADQQIRDLAERYRDQSPDETVRQRLDEFVRIVRERRYDQFYGDIPRRPLFLRQILECVASDGIMVVGRAALFDHWATMKVRRDLLRPIQAGGEGRGPILTNAEGLETTVGLAFLAMTYAAACMTRVEEGALELQPDCDLDEVLASHRRFAAIVDPTGLFLNSLLQPLHQHGAEPAKVRFAHRAFQEFFLARYIRTNPDRWGGVDLPEEVNSWLVDLGRTETVYGLP